MGYLYLSLSWMLMAAMGAFVGFALLAKPVVYYLSCDELREPIHFIELYEKQTRAQHYPRPTRKPEHLRGN